MTKKSKAFMIINCLALMVIVANLTSPVHEAAHMLTQIAAGMKPECLAFGINSTVGTPSVDMNSFFWKLMFEGSAALVNIVIGLILLFVLKRFRLSPLSRAFTLMLTMSQLSMGFGYFLRDFFLYDPNPDPDIQQGDWAKVFENFDGNLALRITMLIIGCIGILFVFFIAYRQAFHFISDNNDKKERNRVALAIYLFPYLVNAVVFTLVELRGPVAQDNINSFLIISPIINIFGMIGFFWGYMFVAHMVKPRKQNVYYFSPCAEKKIVLWIVAAALLAFDALFLCPGFYF